MWLLLGSFVGPVFLLVLLNGWFVLVCQVVGNIFVDRVVGFVGGVV